MRFWRRWREERALRRRAVAYVGVLSAEPAGEDVAWLARLDPGGDSDHARWELRYARRAMGLLVAERDALDDRTASEVGRALAAALRFDPQIAPGKRSVAEQQLNARLAAYADALRERRADEPTAGRLGRVLLTFTTGAERARASTAADVARAGETLSRYLLEANEALRESFGVATLPEDVAPSAVSSAAGLGR